MSNSVERKLFFYNFKVFNNFVDSNLSLIFNQYYKLFNNDYSNLQNRGLIYSPDKDEKMYFLDIKDIDQNKAKCILYSLRNKALPHLFNLINGSETEITNDANDALMEQTHFIVYFNQNVIISEYNHFGARIEQLRFVLGHLSSTVLPGNITNVIIDPILLPDEYRNLVDLNKIKSMTFNIGASGLRLFAQETKLPIQNDFEDEFFDLDDLKIEISITGSKDGINFKDKNKILSGIFNYAKRKLKSDATGSNDLSSTLNKSSLKASFGNSNKFLPINLLEDKLVQTIFVPKSSDSNSKYLDSNSLFNEIEVAFNTIYVPISDYDVAVCSE